MTSKLRIALLAAMALIASSCQQYEPEKEGPAGTAAARTRPNILWLVAEDLSANDMGTYGNAASQTPNIDQLARNGTLFSSAFTTTPVCSPARSSLITGMHNTTINVHNHRSHVGPKSPYQTGYTLPEPVKLLPQIFQEAGYTTAIWGKTDYNFNWTEGYDYDFQSETDGTAKGWDEVIQHQPFFMQVHFRQTHRDWDSNERVTDRSQIEIPPIYPDTPEVREAWGDYLDDLALLDRKVGALLARLEEDGLADNTAIIFFSDHGREMPRGKQWVYDGGIHVPLIIRLPNEETPGTVDKQLISNVDISAASLDLAGIEVPAYFDGRSFLDTATEERDHIIATRDRDDETFDRVRAVRTHQYKYIRNYYPELPWTRYNHYIEQIKEDGQTHYETFGIMRELHAAGQLTDAQALFWAEQKPREELYDIVDDPWETTNLADDPEMQDVLDDLRGKLDGWIEAPHPDLGWRDKGAVPEDGTRLFVISQNSQDPGMVDIVTTVDDLENRDCSLKVEYSLDAGATWYRAVVDDVSNADYGDVIVDNESDYQLSGIETRSAGANTVRIQWDTQSEDNGSGAMDDAAYDQVLLRITQSNGEVEREPWISTRGFYRQFPAVVVDESAFKLRFDRSAQSE
jgi:uncharacterized sulfatase